MSRGGLDCAPATGTDVTGTLAVGGGIGWNIVPHAIGAAALFLLGGAAGLTVLIVTGVRRANARR